jgi:hypothetical protein
MAGEHPPAPNEKSFGSFLVTAQVGRICSIAPSQNKHLSQSGKKFNHKGTKDTKIARRMTSEPHTLGETLRVLRAFVVKFFFLLCTG